LAQGLIKLVPKTPTRSRHEPFPSWAPAEAVEFLKEYRAQATHYTKNDPRQVVPDMLERLLTCDDMALVWQGVRKSSKLFPVEVFAAAAAYSYHEPWDREQRMTPAQHRKWLKRVSRTADKLAKLLRGSALDSLLVDQFDLRTTVRERYVWQSFSSILGGVPTIARHGKRMGGTRTVGPHAQRARFVRHLTGFFREYLGGPRRSLVAVTTEVAFNLPPGTFTERQVARLAP
jgi:hypothetical protein